MNPPNQRCDFSSPITHNVLWDSKVPKHMLEGELCRLEGGWQARERKEVKGWSFTTMVITLFCSERRSVTKLIANCDHGVCGIGRGSSFPVSRV